MKILVSARDPGAAQHQVAFLQTILDAGNSVQAYILCSEKVAAYFSALEFPVHELGSSELEAEEALAQICSEVISEFQPNFVLVGMAYPGKQVDEVLCEQANNRGLPTGSIQDYWGYLGGFSPKVVPNQVFVLDEIAKAMTAKRAPWMNCEIIGSTKHERYRSIAQEPWFQTSDYNSEKVKIGLFCQPLHIPGVLANYQAFAKSLAEFSRPFSLLLRPHPLNFDRADELAAIFSNLGSDLEISTGPVEIERILIEQDLVVSCFSSVGADHSFLQIFRDEPSGSVLYLNIGEDLQKYLQEEMGFTTVPPAEMGLGEVITETEELLPKLERIFSNSDSRNRYFTTVQAKLAHSKNASKTLLSHLNKGIN